MTIRWSNQKRASRRTFVAFLVAGVVCTAVPARADHHQQAFPTADAAVTALVAAAKSDDVKALHALFGADGMKVIGSGDPVADQTARAAFVERAGERTHLVYVGDDFAVLSAGNDDWPFPFPLTRDRRGWSFNIAAGKTELLNRRIGRNELNTIDVCQEYVGAQRDYARRLQRMGGAPEFAQRVRSTPGQRDGLYWEAKAGEDESPMGPLIASASREGYHGGSEGEAPFHGYVFKLLTAQGRHAPGGAHSYLAGGRMTGGFALLAYPVSYGSSGVMTFQVNQQGVVYEKDLGPKTTTIAAGIDAYDPDDSWEPTE